MKECFISVDVETTGPVPGDTSEHGQRNVRTYALLEIGAVVVNDPTREFYVKLKFPGWKDVDPEAVAAIGLSGGDVTKKYFYARDVEYPYKAIPQFAKWVSDTCPGGSPIFVANNAPFDWMFICHEFRVWNEGVNPFGHTALDMKAYFMGLTGCSWKEATLKNMAAYAGISFTSLPHRALDDARIQGEIFRALITKQKGKP